MGLVTFWIGSMVGAKKSARNEPSSSDIFSNFTEGCKAPSMKSQCMFRSVPSWVGFWTLEKLVLETKLSLISAAPSGSTMRLLSSLSLNWLSLPSPKSIANWIWLPISLASPTRKPNLASAWGTDGFSERLRSFSGETLKKKSLLTASMPKPKSKVKSKSAEACGWAASPVSGFRYSKPTWGNPKSVGRSILKVFVPPKSKS